MNRVEELIQQLCPNGVEWKKLGEVTRIERGKRLTKSELLDKGDFPVFHGGIEPLGYYNSYNRECDTVMIINVGASAGTIGYSEKNFWSSDGCFCIKRIEQIKSKFLYYFLIGQETFLASKVRKAGIPTLDSLVVENILVPIPPLPIQQEIVRILDTFTELTANLQTELDARKKQYAYYRDCLLNFEGVDGVEWKKLGEVGLFYGGLSGKTKKDFEEGNAKYVTYSNIFNNIAVNLNINDVVNILPGEKQNVIAYGDVIFTGSSETPDECGMSSVVTKVIDEPIYLNSFCFGFRFNNLSLYEPGFLKFLFRSSNIRNAIKKTANGVTRYNISKKLFSQIEIPILPLPEQRRIVAILDHFETLVNDLSVGLPAELEARRKQYEYYRDKLLTFDRV